MKTWLNKKTILAAIILASVLSISLPFNVTAQSRSRAVKVQKLRWPINTGAADLAPTLSANGQTLIFQSNRGGGKGSHDLYECYWQGSAWSQPVNLRVINTKYFEGYPSLSGDGRTLYFSSNRHTDDVNDPDYDIWVSTRTLNNQWSKPRPLQVLNSDDFDGMVTVSFDKQSLYFASDRSGGMGGIDIWRSSYRDGYWTKPIVLGAPINSKRNDSNPYITPAGDYFFFASDRSGGYGKFDIYRAYRPSSGSLWQLPQNAGAGVNTRTNEYFFTIPNIGSSMYISRGEAGEEDIYEVRMPPPLQPSPVVLIKGRIIDDQTRAPLERVPVVLELANAGSRKLVNFSPPRKIIQRSAAVTGELNFTLLAGTEYNLKIRYKDYSYFTKNIDLRGVFQTEERTMVLEISNRVVIDKFAGVYFATNDTKLSDESKVALRLYVSHLRQNPSHIILLAGYADARGGNQTNRRLARARAEAVRGYLIGSGIDPGRIFTSGGGVKGTKSEAFNAQKFQYYRTVQIKILKQ